MILKGKNTTKIGGIPKDVFFRIYTFTSQEEQKKLKELFEKALQLFHKSRRSSSINSKIKIDMIPFRKGKNKGLLYIIINFIQPFSILT